MNESDSEQPTNGIEQGRKDANVSSLLHKGHWEAMPPTPSACDIVEETNSRTGITGFCALVSTILIDDSGAGNNGYCPIGSATLPDSGTGSTGC